MTDRLVGDLIAGLTVWAVLVPEALAYAATRLLRLWRGIHLQSVGALLVFR